MRLSFDFGKGANQIFGLSSEPYKIFPARLHCNRYKQGGHLKGSKIVLGVV